MHGAFIQRLALPTQAQSFTEANLCRPGLESAICLSDPPGNRGLDDFGEVVSGCPPTQGFTRAPPPAPHRGVGEGQAFYLSLAGGLGSSGLSAQLASALCQGG